MSEVAEVKETVAVPEKESPEKKVVSGEEVEKEANGDSKAAKNGDAKKNGVEKDDEVEDEEEVDDDEEDDSTGAKGENGDSNDVDVSAAPKRKSDVGSDGVDGAAAEEGVSPEKKAKLDEKVEKNGEAEATA